MAGRGRLVGGAVAGVFLGAGTLAACVGTKAQPPTDASASAPVSAPVAAQDEAPARAPDAHADAAPSAPKVVADCKQLPAASEVELPPTDAGTMVNASADAGADRTANDITRVIQRHRDRFRCCYDVVSRDAPGEKGSFVLDFVLAPDGALKSVTHDKAKSDIKSDAMGACAIEVLRGITFPASKRGKESAVSYPFGFKPKAPR
ncbi:MAG: AgmX/PglI C-terminal domain-containing protein [Polyangiaceae bacterium]|nr:AgmX/PglI C-terminal domain-containing protein [Polyangiaceae bacterium]